MVSISLTDRQQEVFDLIRTLIHDRGYGPTVREIGEHFGIKSPNGVMCHLRALEKKGLITRRANKSRAIELAGIHARSKNSMAVRGIMSDQESTLIDDVTEYVDVAERLASPDRFLVKFSGDSQRDEGIRDGDFLVIDPQRHPDDGRLALVQLGDDRVTLRTWNVRGDQVELQSANADPIRVHPGEVKVVGTVSGMVRSFH